MAQDYLDRLAEFVVDFRLEDTDDGTLGAARDVVLDTLGAIIAGSRLPENAALAGLAARMSGPGGASIIGHRQSEHRQSEHSQPGDSQAGDSRPGHSPDRRDGDSRPGHSPDSRPGHSRVGGMGIAGRGILRMAGRRGRSRCGRRW